VQGFSLAVRAGMAVPSGATVSGSYVSDVAWATIPVIVDVNYRFSRHIHAGGYVQYAQALPANCPSDASCVGYDIRFGIEAAYHLQPESTFDPWGGVGIGYEIMFEKNASDSVGTESSVSSGIEFINLQVGGDFRLAPRFWLGPWLTFSLAEYLTDLQGAIPAVHEWFLFGLRGRYDLGRPD
jgi:hypothetical protein